MPYDSPAHFEAADAIDELRLLGFGELLDGLNRPECFHRNGRLNMSALHRATGIKITQLPVLLDELQHRTRRLLNPPENMRRKREHEA